MPTFSDTKSSATPAVLDKRPRPVAVSKARPTAPPPVEYSSRFGPEHSTKRGKIRYAEVNFDSSIQRPKEPGLINSIANEWNEAALNYVTISVRVDPETGAESYWSVDGQQRMEGTIKAGHVDYEFDAVFHYGLTKAQEAELFLDLNNRRNVGAWDKFKNEVGSGNPHAVDIYNVLTELGIAINSPNGFNAWQMALRLVKLEDGQDHFRWALKLIQEVWLRPGEPLNIYDGILIEALARMRHRFGALLSRPRLVEQLQRKRATVAWLVGKRQDLGRLQNLKALSAQIAALTDVYNFKLGEKSPNRLPDWGRKRAGSDE